MAQSKSPKTMVTRRDMLRMSSLALAGGVLAACGASTSSSPSSSAATGSGATQAAGSGELTYLFPDRELERKFATKLIDTFNAKMQGAGQPHRIKAVAGPATDNDYTAKLTLDAASGTLADLQWLPGGNLPDFVAAEYLTDLTPFVNQWADWGKFADAIKQQVTLNNKVYAVSNGNTFTLFYRKDLLDEHGVATTQPRTWDEFYGICDNIASKAGATPAGIPAGLQWGGGSWGEGFQHVWLGYAQPQEIFDPADQKWVISSPALLKAFQVYETLTKNKYLTVNELLAPNPWEPIKYQGFPQKTVAIVTGGDWQWTFDWGPEGATPIEGLFQNVDRWMFPSEVSEPFVSVSPHTILGVSQKTQNAEGAFEFIKWHFSPEGACDAYQIYIPDPSARSDMAEQCDFYRTAVEGKMAQASESFASGRFIRSGPGEAKIIDGIARATESVISGSTTAEQAMSSFAEQMRTSLGENAVKEL